MIKVFPKQTSDCALLPGGSRKQEVDSAEVSVSLRVGDYLCQFAFSMSTSAHFWHAGVKGHLARIHTHENSAGIRLRNFLQLVIDTSKVEEGSFWKVSFQHFTAVRPQPCLVLLDNTGKTIEIYESCAFWAEGELCGTGSSLVTFHHLDPPLPSLFPAISWASVLCWCFFGCQGVICLTW